MKRLDGKWLNSISFTFGSPHQNISTHVKRNNNNSLPPILLDLGGVTFQATGTSNEVIDWSVISPLNYKYAVGMSKGDIGLPFFLADYNAATNQQLTGDEFLDAIWDTLEMNTELVDYLKARYDIIVVSDNYRENIEYMTQRFDFASWATREIYSFDYGMLKEEPAFFERLIKELPYAPEELTLIDDSPNKLAAAATVGIKGILFKNVAGVIAALDIPPASAE